MKIIEKQDNLDYGEMYQVGNVISNNGYYFLVTKFGEQYALLNLTTNKFIVNDLDKPIVEDTLSSLAGACHSTDDRLVDAELVIKHE